MLGLEPNILGRYTCQQYEYHYVSFSMVQVTRLLIVSSQVRCVFVLRTSSG